MSEVRKIVCRGDRRTPEARPEAADTPIATARFWLAAGNLGVAGALLLSVFLSVRKVGPCLAFAETLGERLPLHAPLEMGFLLLAALAPVLLALVAVGLLRGRPVRLLGGLYGGAVLLATLGYALYVRGWVIPAARELERSLLRGGPGSLSHGGHGLRV